jgi:hypothetical protein
VLIFTLGFGHDSAKCDVRQILSWRDRVGSIAGLNRGVDVRKAEGSSGAAAAAAFCQV